MQFKRVFMAGLVSAIMVFSSGCARGDGDKTWKGAGIGAGAGALAGAAIGAATGDW